MMMLMTGLARLGNDPEVRYTPDGKPVMDMSLAFNYGRKVDGKQPSQWISATMWGDRCEKLRPYLTKGQLVFVSMTEPHIEEYKRKDGTTGVSLRARVGELEFAGSRPQEQAAPDRGRGFDDMADDIPF
jgi:single-strand DNA-binding protein